MPIAVRYEARHAAALVKIRQQQQAQLRDVYINNCAGWIEDRAKGFLYGKTREIAESVVKHRRTAVPSAHDIGKSWIAARIAAWWIAVHPPGSAFVVTTAPTNKQVKAVLWKEMRRVYVTAKLTGRLNQTEWWINNEMVAMGRKPNDYDPTAFQGIHAKYVLVIIDEGCGVIESIYVAANSLIANEFGRMLVIGNPDDPYSHFAKVCKPGSGWNVIPVSVFDTPNFTGIDAPQEVKDVLVSQIYVDEMRHDVGEDSPIYIAKVLGQFPDTKLDGVIPYHFLQRCIDSDVELKYDLLPVEMGVDVGAGGDDTSLRIRFGPLIGPMASLKTPKPEEAFELIVRHALQYNVSRVKVDSIGLGWGLLGMFAAAQMRGKHYNEILDEDIDISHIEFIGVNVGQRATDPERFPRLRDQLWWEVGRELSRTQGWDLTGIDDKTIGQLTDPIWRPDLAGRHKVESKQDTMKRTGRGSPNEADALLLAYCVPPMPEQEEVVVYHDPVEIGPSI